MAEELGFDTKEEAEENPERESRRWHLEIKLAQKRERDWRKTAESILNKYRGKNAKKNSFNILWANTETLRPALYNSVPKPDVRRRFRQEDLLGKAVSEVMERSTTYCVDAYDLDNCIRNDVLDALLPGRAVSRVRYIPKIKTVPEAAGQTQGGAIAPNVETDTQGRLAADAAEETDEGAEPEGREEVEYEQALCDHVQWDDFLHGPGKTWDEVPWVGFRHRLTKDDQVEKFGQEIADQVKLGDTSEPELEGENNKDIAGVFKRAEFWEIEDKDSGRVFFINESYKKGLIFLKDSKGEPPLKLKNFFSCPRPLMLVEDTGSLVPIPLYELYKEQAEELDRVSGRITKIINACKVRFVFDPTLTELKALMDADDNVGIPAEQARAWMTNGGIEKAIWWMPIQQIAMVLKELYIARDAAKVVIYEITGISDIIRGATDPRETLGAQKMKANSSSLRLQRMQREVQRYVRDLIRLLAEVIGEHFDQQTLSQMTGLKFPTNAQKQQGQLLLQAAQQAQQQGQQIPPELQQKAQMLQEQMKMPSWEDLMAVMRNDMQREYRVDVETDSTVAQSLQQDMEGLKEVMGALGELIKGTQEAVAGGALSMEAVKSLALMICRRARMGLEVEDAIETGMQQPKPQNDGKAAAEQAKVQAQQQANQQRLAHDQQVAAAKLEHEKAIAQREQAFEEQKAGYEARIKELEHAQTNAEAQRKDDFERWKVEQDNDTKVIVAQIGADAQVEGKLQAAEAKADDEFSGTSGNVTEKPAAKPRPKRSSAIDKLAEMHAQSMDAHASTMDLHGKTIQQLAALTQALHKPKRIVRGPDGRAAGVETVQ